MFPILLVTFKQHIVRSQSNIRLLSVRPGVEKEASVFAALTAFCAFFLSQSSVTSVVPYLRHYYLNSDFYIICLGFYYYYYYYGAWHFLYSLNMSSLLSLWFALFLPCWSLCFHPHNGLFYAVSNFVEVQFMNFS